MSLDLWSMRQRSWHCWLQRKLRQDWPYKPSVSTHGPSIKSKTQKHVFKTHDMHIQVITCIWNFKKVSLLRIQLVLEISCTTYASNWVNPKTFQNINRRSKSDKTLLAWIYTKNKFQMHVTNWNHNMRFFNEFSDLCFRNEYECQSSFFKKKV